MNKPRFVIEESHELCVPIRNRGWSVGKENGGDVELFGDAWRFWHVIQRSHVNYHVTSSFCLEMKARVSAPETISSHVRIAHRNTTSTNKARIDLQPLDI